MKVAYDDVRSTLTQILLKLGSDEYETDIVSSHLARANLKGHHSHGAGMIVAYASYVQKKILFPNTKPKLLKESETILQFNGQRGFGQRIGKESMDIAIAKAKKNGLCLMTIANTCHLGRIGTYGEQATAEGLISIHFVNVADHAPLVAPYAGIDARFGTNPICISIPKSNKNPEFILDFATSIVALGKTRVAWIAGKKFDDKVLVDADGNLTNDPTVMWDEDLSRRGALLPIAKHKGGGLILAAELLAGILSGGGTIQPENERKNAIKNNMTTILINPEHLASLEYFQYEYDAMLEYMQTSRESDPVNNPILVAGEPERRTMQESLQNGIEISEQEWNRILATLDSLS